MARKMFNYASIVEMPNGEEAITEFDRLIRVAAEDCAKRPDVPRVRKVLLAVVLERDGDQITDGQPDQPGRPRPADPGRNLEAADMDSEKPVGLVAFNEFLVAGAAIGQVAIMNPPVGSISADRAMALAAWLEAIAKPYATYTFGDYREAVRK